MDSADAVQQAVAIRGARLQAVGRRRPCAALAGPATHIIDLQGHTGVPGLIDTPIWIAKASRISCLASKAYTPLLTFWP